MPINPESHDIIAYSIATFSNHMLQYPVKMYHFGSHLSTTSYDVITSEWNCTTLGLIEMHGNGLKIHIDWNEYSLEVPDAV